LAYRTSSIAFDKGGATILQVAVQVRGRSSERKKFDSPPLVYLEDIKEDITVFITAITTHKRCLPAPNDYNSGLCDYHMAMAMARLKL